MTTAYFWMKELPIKVWRAIILLFLLSTPSLAQQPEEPWRFHQKLSLHSPIVEALDQLFSLALSGDEVAFRRWFTPESVERLEASWSSPDGARGSWATMMKALVPRHGAPPDIVEVSLDDQDAPQEATVTIAMDGRRHTLYLKRTSKPSSPWRLDVRQREADSLNLDISIAAKERSIMEISFGTGLGAPARYASRYDDNVNLSITSSLWVFAEVFAKPWLRLGALLDLPLGFQTIQVGGETVEEFVPARVLAGVTWAPIYVDFAARSRLEAQLLTYAGATVEGHPRLVPLVGGRLAFLQNAYEGADIYLGIYYQGAVDVLGILYGVGYRF